MKNYRVEKAMAASPETVWACLTDTSRYGEWVPSIERFEGKMTEGEQLTMHHTSGNKTRVQVTQVESPRQYILSGGLPLNMVTGTRSFQLTPQANGHTLFVMEEIFSGWLMPILGRAIPDLSQSFEDFAVALQNRVELPVESQSPQGET